MGKIIEYLLEIYPIIAYICLIVYLPRLRYYLDAFKKQKKIINFKFEKLSLIIPAREEALIIANLFETIKAQNYPLDSFDVHIIVDNENDETIKIAKEYFTNLYIHIIKEQKCKGDALDGCFKWILEHKKDYYSAHIIVDADNLLSFNFLNEMNNALVLDKQVVIAKKVCKNWESVNKKDKKLITNMSGLTFVYIDALGNKYRSKKNIPVSITGTGLMVRNDLIKEIKGWPYKTLTEDFELVMSCIINKYTSTYYEHAVVYCEEPTTHHETVKRRVRWLSGYAQVNKKYRKDVIKTTFPFKFSLIGFDFLYSLLPVYFFFGLSGVLVILGLLYSLYGHYHNIDISLYVNGSLNILLIVYLVLVFYTLIGLIAERKSIKLNFWDKILVLLFNPFFMAEYLFIIILAFMNKTNQNWVLTKREEVNYNLNNHNGESNKERALRLMHEYELEGKFNEHVYPIDPQSFEEVKADYEYHNRHQIRIFLVRFIAFIVSFIISKFIFRTKVKGLENLKNIKGCILISNHIDHLDSLPIRYYLRKKLYILSGQFNNKKGLLGFLLKNSGCLPLSNNIVSMKNLNKEISNLLKKKNNALLICPEGSEWPHYRKPRPFHSGAFHYAVKNNVPIVPLFYTFKKTIFGYKHYLNILKPIEVPSDIIGREAQIMMQEKAYSAFVQTYEGFYEGVKLI